MRQKKAFLEAFMFLERKILIFFGYINCVVASEFNQLDIHT